MEKKKLTCDDIGEPFNFQHVAHVGFDLERGFRFEGTDPTIKVFKEVVAKNIPSTPSTQSQSGGADISTPFNIHHVAHVGWDPQKGFYFHTIDVTFKELFEKNLMKDKIQHKLSAADISHPFNFQHVAHVGFNSDQGLYFHTVDPEFKEAITKNINQQTTNLNRNEISAPFNFQHVAHVGFDSERGFYFHTIDPVLKEAFSKAGLSEVHTDDK